MSKEILKVILTIVSYKYDVIIIVINKKESQLFWCEKEAMNKNVIRNLNWLLSESDDKDNLSTHTEIA